MKVTNMNGTSNQFIIDGVKVVVESNINSPDGTGEKRAYDGDLFQSYNSVIAFKPYTYDRESRGAYTVYLDEKYWNYSATTGKYRNQFLGENIAETRKKIESGEYILCDLN